MHDQHGDQDIVNNTLNTILALPGIKEIGINEWIARCPAHDDKTPSLAIRTLADGTILLHCFTLCSIEEIVSALGLELKDLFPPRPKNRSKPIHWNPRNVLDVLQHESLIVVLAAESIIESGKLTKADLDRLSIAVRRINESVRLSRINK